MTVREPSLVSGTNTHGKPNPGTHLPPWQTLARSPPWGLGEFWPPKLHAEHHQ